MFGFGLELLRKCVEDDIKRKADRVVVILHWLLIKDGFRCIGCGDEKLPTGEETKSELLPAKWNDSTNYTLHYIWNGLLYVFTASKASTPDDVLVNLVRSSDKTVFSCIVPLLGVEEEGEATKNIIERFDAHILRVLKLKIIHEPCAKGKPMAYFHANVCGNRPYYLSSLTTRYVPYACSPRQPPMASSSRPLSDAICIQAELQEQP